MHEAGRAKNLRPNLFISLSKAKTMSYRLLRFGSVSKKVIRCFNLFHGISFSILPENNQKTSGLVF